MNTKPNAGPPIICGRPYVLFDPEQTAEIIRVGRKNAAIIEVVKSLNAALTAVDDFAGEYGPEDALLETVQEATRRLQYLAGCTFYPDLDAFCSDDEVRRITWKGEVETLC